MILSSQELAVVRSTILVQYWVAIDIVVSPEIPIQDIIGLNRFS